MMQTRSSAAVVTVVKRGYAAAAHHAVKPHTSFTVKRTDQDYKTTRLPNGLVVSSVDLGGGVSRFAYAFRAGSRYETVDNFGVTHRLRNTVGQTGNNLQSDYILGTLGSVGASISASTTRDLLIFESTVVRDYYQLTLDMLTEASQPGLKPWDLDDTHHHMKRDNHQFKENHEAYLLEMLYKAAYHNEPLGNSLFSPDHMVGKHNHYVTQDYVDSRLVSGECALVGVNIEHGALLSYASDRQDAIQRGEASKQQPSKYFGGEVRADTGGPLAYVMLGAQSQGFNDQKTLVTNMVLASAFGAGRNVKWCSGQGRLSQAAAKAVGEGGFSLSPVVSTHSDGGLVGIYCVAPSQNIQSVLKAITTEIKTIADKGFDKNELNKARLHAKLGVLVRAEDGGAVLEDTAAGTLAAGLPPQPTEITEHIDGVTLNELSQAAKTFVSGKFSMAAMGNVNNTPYLNDL